MANKNSNSNLNLSFTFKNKHFYLCAQLVGTTKRAYKVVPNLINPNFESWDKKKQLFNEPTAIAMHNNTALKEFKERLECIISTSHPQSPKQLLDLYDKPQESKHIITFKDYIETTIDTLKEAKNKRPSKTYQTYITLLHKLEEEKNIWNKAIQDINNDDFIKFGDFILKQSDKVKNNYMRLMRLFKAVHSRAANKGLNGYNLTYNFAKDAPPQNAVNRHALTKVQYNKFVNYDLSKIRQSGFNPTFYKELYRDFCIFMFESKIRPCDIVKLRHDNIINNCYVEYEPEKKKNYREAERRVVRTPLTKTMKDLIKKYRGKSTQGYIFPFTMNELNWNFNDSKSWNKWQNKKQSQLEAINKFLHKFVNILNTKPITLYTFRHTAFTLALQDKKCNIIELAKQGGTSIDMLSKSYYHQHF